VQYRGVGTINGEGECEFILTGIDADINENDSSPYRSGCRLSAARRMVRPVAYGRTILLVSQFG
jgi:hypothetical protein